MAIEREERRAEGWGVGRRCPLPTGGEDWGGDMPPSGYAPFPEFFCEFWAQYGKFWCILGANFIAVELSDLHT